MPVTRNYSDPSGPAGVAHLPGRVVVMRPNAAEVRVASPGVLRGRVMASAAGITSARLFMPPLLSVRRPGLGFLALTTYPAIYKTWRGVTGPATLPTPREFPPLYARL